MLTQLFSFANIGLQSEKVTVEVASTAGEHHFFIVGLGDTAVQESKQRVKMAVRSSGYRIPTGRMITVNLAPADIRKVGPRYDLPIALGLLLSLGIVRIPPERVASMALLGELALDGKLRHVTGVLPAAIACARLGIGTLVVPSVNGAEAALIPGVEVIAPESLQELVQILCGDRPAPVIVPPAASATRLVGLPADDVVDFADVRGQQTAKRALEVAAAGGHNILLRGPPGSGKTLLARAFRGILPPLSMEEAIEVTQVYSVANLLPKDAPLVGHRPFRMVHHTASGVAIVGGGSVPGPGEISLAHRGVLFLDELGEFPAAVLEVLRQPIEDRTITITRAAGSVTFPADFILVAAMNPPPSVAEDPGQKVQRRISAPLLDRMDLRINVEAVPIEDLQRAARSGGDSSSAIRDRVVRARNLQRNRFRGLPMSLNKEMGVRQIDAFCPLDVPGLRMLQRAVQKVGLSARGYHRVIKVARTIADLAGEAAIGELHVAEALRYRENQV